MSASEFIVQQTLAYSFCSNDKATFYVDTQKSSYLRGRRSIVPCANILGGGSSINFQMYTRASASDWGEFTLLLLTRTLAKTYPTF